uniref:Uncharacterized protein n=1 Tax=Heliothis virescens TaxID=7102 RepID=A0A2A4J6X2_HELVI
MANSAAAAWSKNLLGGGGAPAQSKRPSLLLVCTDFQYIGSLIHGDRIVKHRTKVGWMKWRQVTGTTCDFKLKEKIYKGMVRPAALYASPQNKRNMNERQLHAAKTRMLRGMCGFTLMDRMRNEYIRGSLKVAPVTEKIWGNRLACYGHVMRTNEDHVRNVLAMNVDG